MAGVKYRARMVQGQSKSIATVTMRPSCLLKHLRDRVVTYCLPVLCRSRDTMERSDLVKTPLLPCLYLDNITCMLRSRASFLRMLSAFWLLCNCSSGAIRGHIRDLKNIQESAGRIM